MKNIALMLVVALAAMLAYLGCFVGCLKAADRLKKLQGRRRGVFICCVFLLLMLLIAGLLAGEEQFMIALELFAGEPAKLVEISRSQDSVRIAPALLLPIPMVFAMKFVVACCSTFILRESFGVGRYAWLLAFVGFYAVYSLWVWLAITRLMPVYYSPHYSLLLVHPIYWGFFLFLGYKLKA